MASIYGLLDACGDLRYIGKANDPAERLRRHLNESKFLTRPVHNWLRKHGSPTMIVLEEECQDWELAERDWILAARIAGVPLLNVADGGACPYCDRQTRVNNGKNLTRHRFTSEQARTQAWRLNRDLKRDARFRFKQMIALTFRKHGFGGRALANLWFLAHHVEPLNFRRWFERMVDKNISKLHAFTEADWADFQSCVAEVSYVPIEQARAAAVRRFGS